MTCVSALPLSCHRPPSPTNTFPRPRSGPREKFPLEPAPKKFSDETGIPLPPVSRPHFTPTSIFDGKTNMPKVNCLRQGGAPRLSPFTLAIYVNGPNPGGALKNVRLFLPFFFFQKPQA